MSPSSTRARLEQVRIARLGVIEDATLELHPGFTVVTGETGAGKTMVVEGLSLLFGARLDAARIKDASADAVVEGRLSHPPDSVASRAHELGADVTEDNLILARTVTSEGRSRCQLGGRAVPVAVLAELAESLVAIHGQSQQLQLLRPAAQLAILDRYAGDEALALAGRYVATYDQWSSVRDKLAVLTAGRDTRAAEADLLRLGVDEVARVAPTAGEDEELVTRIQRLTHATALSEAAATAHAMLAAAPDDSASDAVALLSQAQRALDAAGAHDPALGVIADRLKELAYLAADVGGDLASYVASVEVDATQLEAAQQRLAALRGLIRKYAPDLSGVLAWVTEAETRLVDLEADDDRIKDVARVHAAALADLGELAARLAEIRVTAAGELGAAVTAELAALAMPDAQVVAQVTRRPDDAGLDINGQRVAFTRSGTDAVELLLAAHAGAAPRPVARAASGGELSRVMLALEVVFAAADPVPTLVFDEVDAGVGGRAAVEVGRRLARLARTHQVVAVTHLPQVAAFADRHLVVTKSSNGVVTTSDVRQLDDAERLRELSRMLAGLDGSALALGHAEELLAVAAGERAAIEVAG